MDTPVTVKHPRTLAAVRVVLVVLVAALVLPLVVIGLSLLGLGLLLAGLSLAVTGDANLLGFGTLALAGLLGAGGLSLLVAVGARRIDRHIRMADRRPDPVEIATRAYVAGDIDERALEQRLERALSPSSSTRRGRLRTLAVACGRRLHRRSSTTRSPSSRSPVQSRLPSSPRSRSRTREQ